MRGSVSLSMAVIVVPRWIPTPETTWPTLKPVALATVTVESP